MGERFVVFSHGKDSEPWGTKIMAMADTARFEGYGVESVDYRGIDTVKGRTEKLIDACKNLPGDLVLVGSSLGGFISLSAATMLHARGVFLLAPALYLDALPPLKPNLVDCPVAIVHGWHDDVVPLEHSLRFAREYNARLHILNDDHRLLKQILFIKYLLENFLVTCDLPAG